MKMFAMEYRKYQVNSTRRIRLVSVLCAVFCLIACISFLSAADEEEIIDAGPYLDQLKVDREESWLRKQMLRFGNFRYLDRAYRLINEERLEEAKKEFERYLANDQSDLEARANYLHLLYRMEDYQNVLTQATIILSQRPGFIPARMYRGFAYQRLGALEKALEDFRRVSVTTEAMPADRVLALNTATDLAILLERYSDALELMQVIPEENRDGVYWFRKGLTQERSGDPTAAVESYRQSIRSSQNIPFKITVHRTILNLAIQEGNWSAAAEETKAALELLPGDPVLTRSYNQISFEIAMQNARYREALEIAEILARDPGGPSGWMRVGMTLEKLGRWKEAADAYCRAEALAEDKLQKIHAWQSVAEVAKKTRDWPLTERALMNLQELEPGRSETLRGLSIAAYRQKKLTDAIRWMEMSLSVKEDLDDREFLGNLYMEAGDYDRAIETRKFILRGVRDPSSRHHHYMSIGFAYSQAGRADEAATAFTSAVELQQDLQTLVPLAQALEDAGKLQQAVKYRKSIVSIQPNGANRLALAMLYLKLGEETSALKELESAVHSDMDDDRLFIALKQLASLYQKQGRIDKAEEMLSRAQSLDAEDTFIPLMLAEIALEAGDHAAALENAEKALAGRVTVRRLKMRALIFQEMGCYDKGRADYEKVLQMLPENHPEVPSLHVHIGNLEFSAHRYPEAAEQFLKAFELRPSGDIHPLAQAAESLALASDRPAAMQINRRILDLPQSSRKDKADAYLRLGNIYMQLDQPRMAEESLRNALATGAADSRTHTALGMLLFGQKRYEEALGMFRAATEQRGSAEELLYLARTFSAMKKTGMAIHFLQKALSESQSLARDERETLYRELGFLYAEIHEYAQALEVWKRAESAVHTPEIQLATARMQRLLGNYGEAEKILIALDETALTPGLAGEHLEELALIAYQQVQDDKVIKNMSRAISLEGTPSRHYMVGLAYRRSEDLPNALVHLSKASELQPLNDEYALALAYTLRQSGRRKEAIPILETVASRSPGYLNVVKDLGYLHMQESNNGIAGTWFRRAIDNAPLYPQLTEAEALEVQKELYRLRNANKTVNKWFDLTAYFSYRSNAGPGTASVLGGGVLPSHGGLEIGYLPPKIGYRAGRVFQITGRLLSNTEPESFRPDPDSLQAGVGVRYKPIPQLNLFLSGERIFKIGSATATGWLWRGMYSWTRGRDMIPGGTVRNYSLFYADAGYYTANNGTTAVYSEIHQGAAFRIGPAALLKPHIVVDGRFQDPDISRGTYVEAGGGLSLQLQLFESPYEGHRLGLEFLGHYKRSWLQPDPELQEDRISDGWTFTSVLLF